MAHWIQTPVNRSWVTAHILPIIISPTNGRNTTVNHISQCTHCSVFNINYLIEMSLFDERILQTDIHMDLQLVRNRRMLCIDPRYVLCGSNTFLQSGAEEPMKAHHLKSNNCIKQSSSANLCWRLLEVFWNYLDFIFKHSYYKHFNLLNVHICASLSKDICFAAANHREKCNRCQGNWNH